MNNAQATLPLDTPDITRRKHKGNAESRDAVKRVAPHKSKAYADILTFLHVRGEHTSKEIAADWRVELNTISGRFSELKAGGIIEATKERREGAAILKLTSDGHKALWKVQLGLATLEHEGNCCVLRSK